MDEKGCEAAAATVVKFKPIATMGQKPPPPVFRADHPFAFFLVKSAKEVMFGGAFVGKELRNKEKIIWNETENN